MCLPYLGFYVTPIFKKTNGLQCQQTMVLKYKSIKSNGLIAFLNRYLSGKTNLTTEYDQCSSCLFHL